PPPSSPLFPYTTLFRSLLPLHSDHFVEGDRLADRIVVGGGVGADLFELADVARLLLARCHQRPDLGDALLLDIEESGADGGHQRSEEHTSELQSPYDRV